MRHLPNIARLAKGLRVRAQIATAATNRNDVIENKCIDASAPTASRVFPFTALERSEVLSVSRSFAPEWFNQVGASGKHLVSIFKPALFQRSGHLGSRFRRLRKAAFLGAWVLWGISTPTFADSDSRGLVVNLPPERIVFSHDCLTATFGFTAGDALGASQVHSASIDQIAADNARHFAAHTFGAGFLARNGISHNGVKSVETPLYGSNHVRAIPSQAAQECVEGVTTRAWSPDRTVKPHERATRKGRDSLGLQVTARSAGKELRDNTSDEVINVSPNSPISAAQYQFAQYAGAVSISGLEMLQNSGKEAIIDLLSGRHKVTEAQLMNRIDYDLYQDGTGNSGKNLTGLAAAVPDVPSTGTYGGIVRSTWTFWQPQKYSGVTDGGAAVSASNIQAYMTTLGLRLVRGMNKPDLWVADNTYYGYYINSLQAIQRITSDNGSGNAGSGFGPEIKFYGGGMAADVVLGGGISGAVSSSQSTSGATSAHMWALNTDYLFWRPHADRNFTKIGGERQAVNQDAIVQLIGFAGNLTVSGSEFQGVLIA